MASSTFDPSRVHSLTRPNMVSVGTIVWLSSELMFFAGLFAMYFTARARATDGWPPEPTELNVPYALVVTLILVLRELNVPRVRVTGRRGDAIGLELERGLYTANALANERLILDTVAAAEQPVRHVVLGLRQQEVMSITVLDALENLDRELLQLGVTLHLAALPTAASEVAARTAWFSAMDGAGRVHDSVDEGLTATQASGASDDVHPGEVPDER